MKSRLYRALGTHRRIRKANAEATPVPVHLLPPSKLGNIVALLAAVVVSVKLPTPAALALILTVGLPLHVGRSFAPVGDEANVQDNVTVPVYPFVELTVTMEVPDDPGETVGDVAESEYAPLVGAPVLFATNTLPFEPEESAASS